MEVGHKNSAGGHGITTRWEFQKKGKLEELQWFWEAHEEGPRAFCSLYTMCEMVSLLVVEQKVELLREKASSRERDSQMVLICAKAFVLLF